MPNRYGESAQREENFRPQSPTRRPRFRHDWIRPNITRATRHSNMRPCGTSANRMVLGLLARGGCQAVSTKPLLPSVANTNPAEATTRVLMDDGSARVGAPRGGCPLLCLETEYLFLKPSNIYF